MELLYITAEELRQIADFDFSSRSALAVQRDIFVFQCCVGCRIGDLYRMTWSNVEGEVFRLAGINRVKDPNIVASMSGHKEGSKAFARYREIDKDIKRDALKVFEAI